MTLFSNRFDRSSFNINGGMFGGTVGAQIQQGYVVLGLEGDLDWANIKGTGISTPTIGGGSAGAAYHAQYYNQHQRRWNGKGARRRRHEQLAVLRHGRWGLRQNQRQWYLDCRSTVWNAWSFPNCSASSWRPGLAAGLGAEWGFIQNWSLKLEYLYVAVVGSGTSTDR